MNLYMQSTLIIRKPFDIVIEEEAELIANEIGSCPGLYSDELPTEFHAYPYHYEGYIGAGADKETILSIQESMMNGVRELSRKFPRIEFVLKHEITGDGLRAEVEMKFNEGV